MGTDRKTELSTLQSLIKRCFDICLALFGLVCFGWLILLSFIAASINTGSNGFFVQKRVGRDARIFSVIKIKTMRPVTGVDTTVTQTGDPRITKLGAFFRRTKIDELPQLFNVLVGQMSFVGPRPDVPGFADLLEGDDRAVLSIRPGITGPASLKYKNEEELLAQQADPEQFNRMVIFPDKTKINLEYIQNWSLRNDLYFIWNTVWG